VAQPQAPESPYAVQSLIGSGPVNDTCGRLTSPRDRFHRSKQFTASDRESHEHTGLKMPGRQQDTHQAVL
jgi:hypothetical protein